MILISILLLSGIGGAIIGSVANEVLGSQIVFYFIGLISFFLFSRIDYRIYPGLWKLIYISSLALLSLTLFIGLESRGATRWIPIGPFHLQFSEIFKPLLLVAFSSFLVNQQENNKFRNFIKAIVWISLPIFLIFRQPDLGSTIIYAVIFLVLLLVSGVNIKYLLISILCLGLLAPVGWHFLADYQKSRIQTFVSPHTDPLGASYNSIQAKITIGSGMVFGKGLGRGSQSQLSFLPERHTDFVFASFAEETGFIGSTALLCIYFLLIWRVFSIGSKCESDLAKLICAGVGSMLLAQVFINVGMNIGLLPVTGITLPLVSYGGSSIIATMISLGIVENIASSANLS